MLKNTIIVRRTYTKFELTDILNDENKLVMVDINGFNLSDKYLQKKSEYFKDL